MHPLNCHPTSKVCVRRPCRAALLGRAYVLLLAGLIPQQALAQGAWIGAPGFANGQVAPDAHAVNLESPNQESQGTAIARLDANTIVQAALVKHPSGTQTNGLWNLGLLLFDSRTGARRTWSEASSAYGWFNNQYRIYPNSTTAVLRTVNRVVVARDTIFVLVELQFADRRVVQIFRFSAAGQYLGSTEVFSNGPQTERVAGDMQAYSLTQSNGTRLVVVGFIRNSATGATGPVLRNYIVESGGGLTDATGIVTLDRGACSALSRCQPEALALGFRGIGTAPVVYIASRIFNGANFENQRVYLKKVNASGVHDVLWNTADAALPLGARTTTPGQVSVKGLSVRTTGMGTPSSPYADQVTVVAEVERDCGWGVRVARILNSSNMTYARVLFGGSDASGSFCGAMPPESLFPRSVARDGDTLIVAGRRNPPGLFLGERPFDSFITRVNTSSMTVQRQDTLTWPLVGPRLGNSLINDVLLDGNALIGTGALRYPQEMPTNPALEGKAQSSRMRLVVESIFSNGFEG